jgi:hypothetical protein
VHRLRRAESQDNGIAIPGFVAVLFRPVDRIEGQRELTVSRKPNQIAGAFLGLNPALAEEWITIAVRASVLELPECLPSRAILKFRMRLARLPAQRIAEGRCVASESIRLLRFISAI